MRGGVAGMQNSPLAPVAPAVHSTEPGPMLLTSLSMGITVVPSILCLSPGGCWVSVRVLGVGGLCHTGGWAGRSGGPFWPGTL